MHRGDGRKDPAEHLIVAAAVPRQQAAALCDAAVGGADADLGLLAGYALLRNGQCCEDKIYLELGVAAEAAAWWQHNNAPGDDLITVGAITELRVPVQRLRVICPGRGIPGQPRFSHPGWTDPGPPAGG